MQLANKIALVTGSADPRSIGWGMARSLAQEGANVIVTDLADREAALQSRVEDLGNLGVEGMAFPADLTRPSDIKALFDEALERFEKVDIVVSNAGVIRWEHFLDITPANFKLVVDVNLKGNMLVCQEAAQRMINGGNGGRIIVTSSVQAYTHFPITPVYGGTKHAMHIFVGALALELAEHDITVNHIGPGWIRTAMNDPAPGQQTEEEIEAQKRAVPLGRAGKLEELGRAAVYFSSEDGAYTTGAFLGIDGGLGIGKYS